MYLHHWKPQYSTIYWHCPYRRQLQFSILSEGVIWFPSTHHHSFNVHHHPTSSTHHSRPRHFQFQWRSSLPFCKWLHQWILESSQPPEISNGRAVFISTSGTCGFLSVLWTDTLSNGGLDYSMSGCTSPSSGKPAACYVLYHVMSCDVM